MNRIEESRMSFSSVDEGSDSELSPTTELHPSNWTVSNPRSGTIPGGQFELPLSTPHPPPSTPTTSTIAASTSTQPPVARERALSATDARFESSRKRASSEADKTAKPAKEGGRRNLFSRPSKIMTNFAGGGKDKGKDKHVV